MRFDTARLDLAQRLYNKAIRMRNAGITGMFTGIVLMLIGHDAMQYAGQVMVWLALIPVGYGLWLFHKFQRVLSD